MIETEYGTGERHLRNRGCLYRPYYCVSWGWGDTLPEWLKSAITLERLAMNMKAVKGEEMTGTDAEACA